MRRPVVLLALVLLTLAAASQAPAASKMWFGYQDDQNFRYAPDRLGVIDRAAGGGMTVARITVEWHRAAPARPGNPTNPFDPAYRLEDVDELVRSAQAEGVEVLLTIWGVPPWANGGKGPNFAPRNMNDLRNFARALATRYSGRFAAQPFVRFWSVWNESNLEQFLAPQFNARGKSVAPATYAKLYKAAYDGIKAGSRNALVAIGETSPRGRDRPSPGAAQDSHSPGKFAELVAKANRRLKFDAWAAHPYATEVRARPTQRVKWPNVTLGNLKRFETSLDTWFRRKNIPIWITEYGYQTRPPRPDGVPVRTQASFGRQAFNIAKRDPRVQMFIWFIFRDSPVTAGGAFPWQGAGGVIARDDNPKPAFGALASLARPADARNADIALKAGTRNPTIAFSALELKARNTTGTTIGINYRIVSGSRFIGNAIASAGIRPDGWLSFRTAATVGKKGTRTRLEITATDRNGNTVSRTITLVGT